jgi:hypothetical protein
MVKVTRDEVHEVQVQLDCGIMEAVLEAQRRKAQTIITTAYADKRISEDMRDVLNWLVAGRR